MSEALPVVDRLALATAHGPGTAQDGTADDETGDDGTGRGWCDVVALDGGQVVAMAVGGGSAPAGGPLRRALATLPRGSTAPVPAVEELEHALRGAGSAECALCVTLDLSSGRLRWAGAGHPGPLVVGPDGVRPAPEHVGAGDTVVLVTGSQRVSPGTSDDLSTAAARHHDRDPDALAALLRDAAAPAGSGLVLLVARVLPAPLQERLPAEPRRLAAVRRTVRAWTAHAALSDDRSADLQLLLSEAASNAVEHAYRETESGEFVYSVGRLADGGVRVVVEDFGRWRPPPADPGYRGRGLALIRTLAVDVLLDVGDSGTRVAFTVPVGPLDLDEQTAG